MRSGKLNKITDVPGVRVGHATRSDGIHETGVTVILPCEDNPFTAKLPCASFVLNGFGKTLGLVQIDELGTLETPIALTNTLNVGRIHDALVGYMIEECARCGVTLTSVNPVVCECNDAYLNTIQERVLGEEELREAIANTCGDFASGAVGAGRGMTCHGMKGGIGSASRIVELENEECTVGVLVLTNHGRLRDFMPDGEQLAEVLEENALDKGSCIVVLATDAPLSARQLRRVIKRCSVGLARLGSYIGHGSGEVFIGFSTANRIRSDAPDIVTKRELREDRIDLFFRAAAQATEAAVLDSLESAVTVTGRDGHTRISLHDLRAMASDR